MGEMVQTYWWNAKPNFGDVLTKYLLAHFSRLHAEWARPHAARLVCVGSNLDVLPRHWDGVVAGTGKLHEHTVLDLSCATVLGLRGKLTARGVRGEYVLGDPALLMDEMVHEEKRYNLGVVPHWSDCELAKRFAHLDPHVIGPGQDPMTVVREIARCRKIVSSSLHGIVVADAFAIPRRAELFPGIHNSCEGGEFKFHDYSSAINFPIEFGVLQSPSRREIEVLQVGLFDMFRAIPGALCV